MFYKFNRGIARLLVAAVIMAGVSACSSSGSLRSAYDDKVDFSQYNTYNYFEDAGRNPNQYQSLFSQYMIEAIDKEMQSRGYTRSDNPDLLINFNAQLQDKTKVTTSPSMGMGGYYGYRGGFYDPWMGYGYGTDTHVSQYTEGTYNIDLVDPKTKKLVWEAVGVGKLTEDKLANMKQLIAEGVPEYFALYPFRAGDGTPHQAEK